MKKLFLFLSFAVFALVATAQIPEPYIGLDPHGYVATFFGYVATIILLTGLLNRWLGWMGDRLRYLSWGVALVVGYLGYFFGLGVFADVQWWFVLLYVIAFAAGSNGIANWYYVDKALRWLEFKVG